MVILQARLLPLISSVCHGYQKGLIVHIGTFKQRHPHLIVYMLSERMRKILDDWLSS